MNLKEINRNVLSLLAAFGIFACVTIAIVFAQVFPQQKSSDNQKAKTESSIVAETETLHPSITELQAGRKPESDGTYGSPSKNECVPATPLASNQESIPESKNQSGPCDSQQHALEHARAFIEDSEYVTRPRLSDYLLLRMGCSEADATYAIENCGIDWREHAAEKARRLSEIVNCTHEDMLWLLEKEGYTPEEAKYGAHTVSYDTLSTKPPMSRARQNAMREAQLALDIGPNSYSGLMKSLTEHGDVSHEDAIYAANNWAADWYEQAVRSAKIATTKVMGFGSREDLIEFLLQQGFTREQAEHGANSVTITPSIHRAMYSGNLHFEGHNRPQPSPGGKNSSHPGLRPGCYNHDLNEK